MASEACSPHAGQRRSVNSGLETTASAHALQKRLWPQGTSAADTGACVHRKHRHPGGGAAAAACTRRGDAADSAGLPVAGGLDPDPLRLESLPALTNPQRPPSP